ncbi:exported protein, unknown function [Hepatocystis sp. ex Piliocolobus tephrosceles]|nr:exported protein, unknown function [Hepatocystis sp. ex Piliocolobus tephrosceles]
MDSCSSTSSFFTRSSVLEYKDADEKFSSAMCNGKPYNGNIKIRKCLKSLSLFACSFVFLYIILLNITKFDNNKTITKLACQNAYSRTLSELNGDVESCPHGMCTTKIKDQEEATKKLHDVKLKKKSKTVPDEPLNEKDKLMDLPHFLRDDFMFNITEEKFQELIDALEDKPSKDAIEKIWAHGVYMEINKFIVMLFELYDYYMKTKDIYILVHTVSEKMKQNIFNPFFDSLNNLYNHINEEYNKLNEKKVVKKQDIQELTKHWKEECKELQEKMYTIIKETIDQAEIPPASEK